MFPQVCLRKQSVKICRYGIMVVQRLAKPSNSNVVQVRLLLSALRGISMLNDDIAMFYKHANPGESRYWAIKQHHRAVVQTRTAPGHGSIVKRLRRHPFTVETRVRPPVESLGYTAYCSFQHDPCKRHEEKLCSQQT